MDKEKFQNSQTIVNLSRAFIMESQNGARCKFMAEAANQEKYCYLEELVKKQADRHFAQAKVFYDLIEQNMNDLGIEMEFDDVYPFRKASFEENFEYAAEEAEIARDEIYPEFKEVAEEEGFKEIADKFEHMFQIKNCLYMMMNEVGTMLKDKTLYKKKNAVKWKCDNCGQESISKEAWDKCPFCDFEQGHVVIELKDEEKQHEDENS